MPTHLVDLRNQTVAGVSICQTFAAATTNHEGIVVDLQLTDGPVFAVVQTGTVTGTAVDMDIKLQECATTNGTFSDMTMIGGGVTQSLDQDDDAFVEFVNARRTMRYVRAHAVIAGSAVTSVPLAVTVFGQKKILGGSGFYSE